MAHGTKDFGEEYLAGLIAANTAVWVGLHNDADDHLPDDADVPIPTEPSDGNYARLEYALGTLDIQQNANGDWEVFFPARTFDLTNTTGGTVDSVFATINYQAAGESAAVDHLWFSEAIFDENGNEIRIDLEASDGFGFSGAYTVLDRNQV